VVQGLAAFVRGRHEHLLVGCVVLAAAGGSVPDRAVSIPGSSIRAAEQYRCESGQPKGE
jgi:hypothetical protein